MTPDDLLNELKEIKKDLLALRNLASLALARVEELENKQSPPLSKAKRKKPEKFTADDHIRRMLTKKYKT